MMFRPIGEPDVFFNKEKSENLFKNCFANDTQWKTCMKV